MWRSVQFVCVLSQQLYRELCVAVEFDANVQQPLADPDRFVPLIDGSPKFDSLVDVAGCASLPPQRRSLEPLSSVHASSLDRDSWCS